MKKKSGIVVIGLGNPILGDDALGLIIVSELRKRLGESVDVVELSAGGLTAAETMLGYKKAIIVDALVEEGVAPGKIIRLTLEDLRRASKRFIGLHDMDFVTSVELVKTIDRESFPDEVVIFGITIQKPSCYQEGLSEEVKAAVPKCIEMIEEEIKL
ncbi:MAG: hydrogenase maturation protease [Nitrososphaerota archaeon]|nr:hydrogenase maturation protease [Aigarchaeota archaeon]MDW8076494.1 hydrogenase maturation protease [Nitrososphaerota archaeon]